MKVGIGISSGEIARWAIFYDSLMHVDLPAGVDMEFIQARGAVISENRNGIAEIALKRNCTHVWYVDDDQVFAPDTLARLLAHDLDIVSGLYLQREPPFHPHVYDEEDEAGFCKWRSLREFEAGLVSVKATGAGCLLVKREVFEAMERPWWRLGQITMDGWGDDLNWCHRAREAGFSVWCDLGIMVGHQTSLTVWPIYAPTTGQWTTAFIGKQPLVQFPAARYESRLVRA
jgi:hypothetical protein